MGDEAQENTSGQGPVYDSGRETFPTVLAFEQNAESGPGEDTGKTGAEEGADKDKPAFNLKESPEFKELYDKATEAEKRAMRAEARAEALAQSRGERAPAEQEEEKLDFEDLSALSADDLRTRWDTDPHTILGNILRQARHEIRGELLGEMSHRTTREKQNSGLQAFVKDHPDFLEAYQSGALNEIISANPIHSPVSAYLFNKFQGSVSKNDHEKAVKEAEERGRKEGARQAQIKDGARVLGPGPARHPAAYQSDKKIKTSEYGGDSTQALLQRHRAREAQAER